MGTYTIRFNRRHGEFGHLFSGRYKALAVDGNGNGYLKTVCDYVHLNPVRAGLLAEQQPMGKYVWSSYGEYLKAPGKRCAWLRTDRLLGEWGIPKDSPAGRVRFGQVVTKNQFCPLDSLAPIRLPSFCLTPISSNQSAPTRTIKPAAPSAPLDIT